MIDLKRLSKEAGMNLLKVLEVKGSQKEFETLVEEVRGHALTLNLLGTFLRDVYGGDIRKRDLVKLEEADAEEQGGHAFHVMNAYVKWLEHGGKNDEENKKGRRALAIMRLLGLFDRPATADCLGALWNGEPIPNLTEPLAALNEAQRNIALTRLEAAKLLTVNRDAASALVSLDAHPLLREYFARQLRGQYPDAWHAAHRRLYEYLCASTPDKPQPTLEDLQPLYQAVAHACKAGLQEEACDVYDNTILQHREQYSLKKLGVFGSDLGALACFFDQPWKSVSPSLTEADQAFLMNQTFMCLRALGRLTEAPEPMRVATNWAAKEKDWEHAAIGASNLSELELTLGEVAGAAGAVGHAEQSVTYADRSGGAFWKLASPTSHADALHQAGRRAEAETLFREAEQMQAESYPNYPLLDSVQGFRYCDLLLAAPERAAWRESMKDEGRRTKEELLAACRAVSQRAAQTLKWATGNFGLLDVALNHLTLGRAALYAAILEGRDGALRRPRADAARNRTATDEFETARRELAAAVDGLRRANRSDYLPRGLLTRAWLRFLTGARTESTSSTQTGPESAQEDLDEAREIAERGPMKLFLADIHLYRARLFGRETLYPWESPHADLAEARRLIEKCGYGRRKEELEDAEAGLRQQYS